MRDSHVLGDYAPLKPPRREEERAGGQPDPFADPSGDVTPFAAGPVENEFQLAPESARGEQGGPRKRGKAEKAAAPAENWDARRNHLVTYVGLFLFTAFVFFRPYELFSVGWLSWGTELLAIFTLAAYFPSQLSGEGNLTARPREVKYALLLLLAALLSVPMAISPGEAWEHFQEFFKVIIIFVVIVNAVRTEGRLRGLLLLAMAVSILLSYQAFSDFRNGLLEIGGVRVKGMIGGLFDNPNDLALHLVTMAPLAVALAFARRGVLAKIFYMVCAALFVAGIVVSFSRGGFLGLVAAAAVMVWKLGRKNRLVVGALSAIALAIFIAASPGGYGERITSLFGGDVTGSVGARREGLMRSAMVAVRYPLFGVGIGNFYYKGLRDQVSHNAYTQVAAEMGMAALFCYCMFMFTSLKGLRRIERESLADKERARFYYLSVGVQASLVGYMVSSFFASVAHLWYVYYIVGYAVALRRLYALQYGASPQLGSSEVAGDASEFHPREQPHAGMA